MTLTEDEARTKWCPMARVESSPMFQAVKDPTTGETVVPLSSAVSVNRGGAGTRDEVCCVASNCMMWRKLSQIGIGPNGERRVSDLDGRTKWVDHGYCGLAGNPVARP